jgi:hypothetical protein
MGGPTRRRFLQTLGLGVGTSLFSPFLRSLSAAENGGGIPRRYVFVVEGNCFEPITMLSEKARIALETSAGKTIAENYTTRWFYNLYSHKGGPLVVDGTDFETASALGPVVGKSGELSLASDTAVLLGLSNKITGGGHSAHHGALGCSYSKAGNPAGQTIDAYLAALPAVQKSTPFDAVRLGISSRQDCRLNYDTCAFGAAHAAPIIVHPSLAFNMLFESVASAAGNATFLRRSALLDFAKDDVKAMLQTFPGSSRERAKLEKYLESLEQLKHRRQTLSAMEAQGQLLSKNKPLNPEVNPLYAPNKAPLFMYHDPLDGLRAQFELATAALTGELTNVAVIASATGAHFNIEYKNVAGIENTKRHYIHHTTYYSPVHVSAIHEVTRLQVEMVCKLARDLAATPEPNADGSMLDHTVIVYMSDNGEQHHSTASEWPMLVLGGKKLGMKLGGRTLIYPTLGYEGHRQVSNVFNTLGHSAGEDLNTFGKEGPSLVKPGPLSELYG